MGQKCVVLMPKGTTRSRFENIRKEGASVTIEEGNYDECVRMANTLAEKTPGSVIIQDTAWEGYEDIPTWIMQGYGTIAMEAAGQLDESGFGRPTHVFVQAGVGSFAGAVQGYLANLFPGCCPVTTVVEAQAADCHFASAAARDGEIHPIVGEMNTIMAGLACGEPNTISFDILRNHSSFFASCPDWVTMLGMRMLGAPVKGDPQVVSGESGAVAMGLVASIMKNPEYAPMKEALKLDESSKILMFSTEGDTEPENYRKIVWRV
jgi:diaminopropionate ammonia-lyase